jgi:hypothetical protein
VIQPKTEEGNGLWIFLFEFKDYYFSFSLAWGYVGPHTCWAKENFFLG